MPTLRAPLRRYALKVDHDAFPAYELYVNAQRVYAFNPRQAGTSPLDLYPTSVNKQVKTFGDFVSRRPYALLRSPTYDAKCKCSLKGEACASASTTGPACCPPNAARGQRLACQAGRCVTPSPSPPPRRPPPPTRRPPPPPPDQFRATCMSLCNAFNYNALYALGCCERLGWSWCVTVHGMICA